MTKKLISYLTVILFLIPFTLLIVDNKVLFPFITTKAIFFRILVSIGLVLAIWLYLLNPNSFPKKNYLLIAIALFFIANIIATIFSVNPFRSFWGNAERMEGTWSLFFYLSYFFLLFTLFSFNPQAKKTIFYSILIVTTLISLLEIQQAFILKQERPSATLGNPTYIGFLNLLTIFIILYFYFESRNRIEKSIYISLILLNLLSLIGSQTRGSILGLLVGIFIFSFLYLLFSKIQTRKKILVLSLLLLFIISFFLFLKTEFALKIPGIKRISETLQDPVSVFPRFYAWKIFLTAFEKKPVFGWGPETMPIAFFANFDPQIFNYEQAIFDRPHNKFVEILASTGIFGFLTWLLIFIAFFYYLIKSNINFYQKLTLSAFIFSYLAQNFSLFDMQASYVLFFYGLALISPKIEFKENRQRFIRPYIILVSGLSLVAIIFHLQHFYIVRSIITFLNQSDPKIAGENFLKLSEIAGPFLTEEAVMAMNYFSNNLSQIKDFKTLTNFYNLVEKAYQKDPKDYRLASAFISMKTILIDVQKQVGQDPSKNIIEVEKIYSDLISLYPNFPEIYINYARFLLSNNKKEKAFEILKNGEKMAQNYPKYYFYESVLYFEIKEKKLAYQKLKIATQSLKFNSDQEFEIALKIYLANQDVENSKNIISLWLKQNNSSSTQQKIAQILQEYNQGQFLKLDK
ncbi:MAG: hypothetical protein KatS3mg096_192 [Candidatus Parcubacteria bacterium]|nr:MAG: hypothetical protein KatS3mg096_192 [Candidatus Parcubacteria bacterium]